MSKKYFLFLSIVFELFLVSTMVFLPILIIKTADLKISEIMIIIITFIILLILIFTLSYFINFALLKKQLKRELGVLAISIIMLNIPIIFYWFKLPKREFSTKKSWRMNNYDIAIMGLSLSLFILLSWLQSFIPYMPFFISISIKYIPLFFLAYMSTFFQTSIVCVMGGIFCWVLPNNVDNVDLRAYIFDYFFPICSISVASLLKPQNKKDSNIKWLSWLIFILVPMFLNYLSKVTAGVLFWFKDAWDGYDKWAYSFIFNIFNFTFDTAFSIVVTIPICNTLRVLKK